MRRSVPGTPRHAVFLTLSGAMTPGDLLRVPQALSSREMPLEAFFLAYGKQDRRPGEFVEAVIEEGLNETTRTAPSNRSMTSSSRPR